MRHFFVTVAYVAAAAMLLDLAAALGRRVVDAVGPPEPPSYPIPFRKDPP